MAYFLRISILGLFVLGLPSQACTVFKSPFSGDTRYAHNVDWYDNYPDTRGALFLNPANLQKTGELFGAKMPTAQWVSKYRSITFSIAGAEFPVSGFNEKGLSMAILELANSTYPQASDPRPAFGPSQLIQYNLDRSETIDDIVASTKAFRPYSTLIHMHYFACEASGKCAVIQYINGEMKIYRDSSLPYPVLTNSTYPESAAAAKACIQDSYKCTPSDDSLFRFANAARIRLQEMKSAETFEDDAFGALGEVAQTGPGTITRFQMIMDPGAQVVKIRVRHNDEVGELKVDFNQADCRKPRMMLPIEAKDSGDLSGKWKVLTAEDQTDMATKMGYPPPYAAEYGQYPFRLTCLSK